MTQTKDFNVARPLPCNDAATDAAVAFWLRGSPAVASAYSICLFSITKLLFFFLLICYVLCASTPFVSFSLLFVLFPTFSFNLINRWLLYVENSVAEL